METISKFYHFDETEFKRLLKITFKKELWLKVFLNDSHHGFTHGNQVRLSCLKLIENLSPTEKKKLLQEGKMISQINSQQLAVSAVELAAIFHDCGRFNNTGKVVAEEQKYHQVLSAKRAKIFCEHNGLDIIIPYVEEAILCHDFQSRKLTPDLNSPKSIIGKIVQSADQMGWFHPDSIYRTLNFSKALGVSFYNHDFTLSERLSWFPGAKTFDALTVMLHQLYGPTNIDRFGIEFARNKIEKYKSDLEKNIIKIATENNLKKEVKLLINDFNINMKWPDNFKKGKEIILATASKKSAPNANIVMSLGFIDDKLIIADCQMKKTIKNLRENDKVCVIGGYFRLRGKAKIFKEGIYFDHCVKNSGGHEVKNAILIKVNEVYNLDEGIRIA